MQPVKRYSHPPELFKHRYMPFDSKISDLSTIKPIPNAEDMNIDETLARPTTPPTSSSVPQETPKSPPMLKRAKTKDKQQKRKPISDSPGTLGSPKKLKKLKVAAT